MGEQKGSNSYFMRGWEDFSLSNAEFFKYRQ